ncbi:hypothetical protein GCM10009630_39440 [Kribbella jejuensis]
MDGQQADGGAGGGPADEEIAKLREFLGVHTGPGSAGSHKGERPDNVRPLAPRREGRVHEVD